MTDDRDITTAILTELDRCGHLKPSARKDASVLLNCQAVVASHLIQERQDMTRFIEWWGQHAHNAYHDVKTNPSDPFVRRDFYSCQNDLCLSLVGTLADLTQDQPIRTRETPKLS